MRIKGAILRARLKWVETNSPQSKEKLLERLSAGTRATLETGIVTSAWYPFDQLIDMNVTMDKLFGTGDLSMCLELGRYGCEVNLPTLYRLFFSMSSVSYIIKRCAAAWHVNYDEGTLEIVEHDEERRVVRIRMVGDFRRHRAHCLSVKGWIMRAGELSGAKQVRMTETCRCLGHPECEFTYKWE